MKKRLNTLPQWWIDTKRSWQVLSKIFNISDVLFLIIYVYYTLIFYKCS